MSNNPMGGLGALIGSLFGQETNPQDIQRFDQQYASGSPDQLDNQEVQQRYRQVLRNAPPDVVEDAHAQAFSQLDPQQRQDLAQQMRQQAAQMGTPYQDPRYQGQYDADPRTLGQMAQHMEQRNPSVLDQVLGGQSGALNNPLVKMAIAGAATMAARKFLGGQTDTPLGSLLGGQGGADMLGSLLGGQGSGNPLGGLMGSQQTGGPDTSASSGGSFGGTEV